jgi:hypothetical protein
VTLRGAGVVSLLAFAAQGCLVAPPQGYEEPRRTPPILDLYSAKPFVGEVLVVDRSDSLDTNDRIEFKIPVRSDDQGEVLSWMFYGDRTFSSQNTTGPVDVPASTIDDTTRYVQHTWWVDNNYTKGCHTLSFVIAHRSSWNTGQSPPLLIDVEDAAVGTWWVNIDPGAADPNTLVRCPSRAEIQE